MKKQKQFTCALIFFLFLYGWNVSLAQTSATAKYRWSKNASMKLSADVGQAYQRLPEADYTPQNTIGLWSAAEQISTFAAEYNGSLHIQCVLAVDEQGYVRGVKVISTNDQKSAGAVKALLINSKVAGPSYDHNKAVSCYVPCSIEIAGHQVSVS